MSRTLDPKQQQTCYALEACNQDQIIDLFEESFGYLSFVEKFVQRIKKEPIDYDTDTIAASSRPLIILDIDNTLLYCRYFADEICVDDNITYYYNGMDETSGTVTSVWYRLKLHLSDDDLIDFYNTDIIEYDHCHTSPTRLKKKKTFTFPYKIDDKTNEILDCRQTLIKELTVIGCEIKYELNFHIHHKFISFEDDSIEIENFMPSFTRKGYDDAAFIYNGFIVRLRYGLEDFVESLDSAWDIVLFTAAAKNIYEGLTCKLHEYLCDIMGRDDNDTADAIWKHILYREDCCYDYDSNGKLFHHKDLTKFNKDLSRVIIVDNNELAYKSLEPNAILIKDYMGKDKVDNELDSVLEKLDEIIEMEQEANEKHQYIDFRYILSGIPSIPTDLNEYNRQSPNDILLSTQRFLNDLKESLIKRQLLSNSLNFSPTYLSSPTGLQLSIITSSTNEIKTDQDVCIDDAMLNVGTSTTDTKSKKKGLATPSASRHSYTISLKLQDIPHFDIDFEMNNLTPLPNLYDYDYGDGEDEDGYTTDEEYESEEKVELDIEEEKEAIHRREASKMKRIQTQKRISFSMKPRPENSGAPSALFLQKTVRKIVAFHENAEDFDEEKVDEIKKKFAARPVPAPPPKIKRVDNPFVAAKIKNDGVLIGGSVTLGNVMRRVPNRKPPPAPQRRKKLPPPRPPRRPSKPKPPQKTPPTQSK